VLQVEIRVRELRSVVADQESQLKDKQKEIDRLMRMLEFEDQ
jgi:cell division protein FtsL